MESGLPAPSRDAETKSSESNSQMKANQHPRTIRSTVRTGLTIDRNVYNQLSTCAEQEGVTRHKLICRLLSDFVKSQSKAPNSA